MLNVAPNTIFTEDNLYVMHGLNSSCVDLIYLDPPFNSKRMYSAPVGSKAAGSSFLDIWKWEDVDMAYMEKLYDQHPQLVKFILSAQNIHTKALSSYLAFMAQRIIEMHRILKPTGHLYLHCDQAAGHYLKIVLDSIFGQKNLRGAIVWRRHTSAQKGSQFESQSWGNTSDYIFHYTKTSEFKLKTVRDLMPEEVNQKFPLVDEKHRRYYDDSSHIFSTPGMGARPNLCYEWKGFRNPHPSGWRLSKETLEKEYKKGNIVITKEGKIKRRKYKDDYKGVPLGNVWTDINPASGKENTGYPTQKPLSLLKRIIESSTATGELVFDPFCGCATTMVAAQQLQRKWLGVDLSKKSAELVATRLEQDAKMFTNFIHLEKPPIRTDTTIEKRPSVTVKEALYKSQKGRCNGCVEDILIKNMEIDHILPKSKGGQDVYDNFQLLCGNCNRRKGDRPMEHLIVKINSNKEALNAVSFT